MITLYNLLNEKEYRRVKDETDIRNSQLNDITVIELFELSKIIPITMKWYKLSRACAALHVLEDRERKFDNTPKACDCIWRCHCDL